MNIFGSLSARVQAIITIAVAACMIAVLVGAGTAFYFRGQAIMELQLKERLRSTAAAAVMQFEGDRIERILPGAPLATSPELHETVMKLQALRENVTSIRFAYIMRKSDDSSFVEFVADADMALSDEELDRNGNGILDDDEAAAEPGELYDISGWPALQSEAFLRPSVDEEVGSDQWGPVISGYAPIRRENGEVVAVLGIDMDAHEFTVLSQSIFSPVALLLTLLASLFLVTGGAIFFWRRRLKMFERLSNERSGLLRLAFHQLGGPLTIINWSLEELEAEGISSIERTVASIKEGVKRLTTILDTLKSADLVHVGKIHYKLEFASLTTVLEHVVKEAGTKLAVKKQRVILDLEENIMMKLDPKLITGVAQELLENAIDYSPDNTTIRLSSRRAGRYAEFSVSDHGCGIPKKDQHRIFDEFTRGSNATKYKADGNGLGLYIVRGIIAHAGGIISIQSQEGTGTTVTVRLPIV